MHVLGGEQAVEESVSDQVLDSARCVAADDAQPGGPDDNEDDDEADNED